MFLCFLFFLSHSASIQFLNIYLHHTNDIYSNKLTLQSSGTDFTSSPLYVCIRLSSVFLSVYMSYSNRWNVHLDTAFLNNTFSFLLVYPYICVANTHTDTSQASFLSLFSSFPCCPVETQSEWSSLSYPAHSCFFTQISHSYFFFLHIFILSLCSLYAPAPSTISVIVLLLLPLKVTVAVTWRWPTVNSS